MPVHDTGMFIVKEINRLKILQGGIERNLQPVEAAEMLGITPRHCSRLLKRYCQSGPLGMNNQPASSESTIKTLPGAMVIPSSVVQCTSLISTLHRLCMHYEHSTVVIIGSCST